MSEITQEQRESLAWVRADVDQREFLAEIPDDLPPRGALLRMPDSSLGEVVSWMDRNPHGDREISELRIALVELIDSAVSDIEHGGLQIVPEDRMTLIRSEPSTSFIKRWLLRREGTVQ